MSSVFFLTALLATSAFSARLGVARAGGPPISWGTWGAAIGAGLLVAGIVLFVMSRWLRLQRRIEAVAREWQLTIDAVADPILTLDPEGRILRMNRAAMELSGKPYRENLGREISELGAGEPWLTAGRRLAGTPAEPAPPTAPVEDPVTGESWEIAVSTVNNPVRNRPTTIVVAHNVTKRVELQESLHRQELLSAMGTLVAGVAHDMRNFVIAINGTAHVLEKRLAQHGDVPHLLPLLREQGERMNALMQTLLDFGKPAQLIRTTESIVELIQEACRICGESADRKNVELALQAADDVPHLNLDRTRMLQAFNNLIENAIQHSPEGGTVSLAARSAGRWVECRIRDTGPGFDEEDVPRLFEPFFTRREGGTGFGLAIARRVVTEHGGEIEAANHEGGGALFRLRLPIEGSSAELALEDRA